MSNAMRSGRGEDGSRVLADDYDPLAAMREELQAELDSHLDEAKQTWRDAESQLRRTLRENRRDPEGRFVWKDSASASAAFAAEGMSPPLRRKADSASASTACPSVGAGSGSEDEDKAEKAATRQARIQAARDVARANRAQAQLSKGAESALKMEDHLKRRLRKKITSLLSEVRKRSRLQHHQEKERDFGSSVDEAQVGRWSTGKMGSQALGLDEYVSVKTGKVSPRKAVIAKCLTLEEHEMLRKDPTFFLADQEPAAGQEGTETSRYVSVRDLVDFFQASREENGLPIERYVQLKHAALNRLAEPSVSSPSAGASKGLHGGPSLSSLHGGPSLHSILGTSVGSAFDHGHGSVMTTINLDGGLPFGASAEGKLARMPCCGRRPAVRDDKVSPTLTKVRHVCQRKAELEAAFAEAQEKELLKAEADRDAIVAEAKLAKQDAVEDRRENNQHRLYMAAARKAQVDAETREQVQLVGIQKMQAVFKACELADLAADEKRRKASHHLEHWKVGLARAAAGERKHELRTLRALERERDGNGPMATKLSKIADKKASAMDPSPLTNDKIKKEIQTCLFQELQEKRRQETLAVAAACETRLQAANERRRRGMTSRYRFTERAFGASASAFDHKVHTFTADRRGESWRMSQEPWRLASLPNSASAPELGGAASPG